LTVVVYNNLGVQINASKLCRTAQLLQYGTFVYLMITCLFTLEQVGMGVDFLQLMLNAEETEHDVNDEDITSSLSVMNEGMSNDWKQNRRGTALSVNIN